MRPVERLAAGRAAPGRPPIPPARMGAEVLAAVGGSAVAGALFAPLSSRMSARSRPGSPRRRARPSESGSRGGPAVSSGRCAHGSRRLVLKSRSGICGITGVGSVSSTPGTCESASSAPPSVPSSRSVCRWVSCRLLGSRPPLAAASAPITARTERSSASTVGITFSRSPQHGCERRDHLFGHLQSRVGRQHAFAAPRHIRAAEKIAHRVLEDLVRARGVFHRRERGPGQHRGQRVHVRAQLRA